MPRADAIVITLCDLGMVCAAIGAGVLPVFLTTFSEEFGGLTPDAMGQLPALLFAGVVLGILVSGPAADRLGEKLFAVGGAACVALGLAAAALAPSFGMLLAAAGFIGFGAGVLDMLMSPIVAAVAADRRAAALNQLHAFWSIGVVATVVVSAVSLYLALPWRGVVGALALLPVGVALGFLFTPLPPMVHPSHERKRLRTLLRVPRFLLALFIIFLIGCTEEGMSQWLPAYAEQELGYSKGTAGMALCGYALVQSLGRLLGSTQRVQRISPYRLMACCAVASVCCYLVAAWAPLPAVGLAACVLAGLAVSVQWPTHLGITADRIPQGGGSMWAVLAAAGNSGCVFSPWVEGQIAAVANLHVAIAIAALGPVLLALFVLWSGRWDAAKARTA